MVRMTVKTSGYAMGTMVAVMFHIDGAPMVGKLAKVHRGYEIQWADGSTRLSWNAGRKVYIRTLGNDFGPELEAWKRNGAEEAEQSGMDILADLLSLDGGETPAKVIDRTRLVTVAPANTPCGWTGYGETGTKLTCESGKDAAHVLTETLPVAVKGTALCGFHSPYDVTDADRQAMADEKAWLTESEASWQAATSPTVDTDPDKCPKHGGYNIPGEAECAGCTWGDLVTRYQGTVEGKRAIGVAHSYAGRTYREGTAEYFYAAIDSITMAMVYSAEANNACRSTNHIYCVGPCPIRTRNEANASAARTTVETEAECAARIKREDFRVGDVYTFRNMVGYKLHQDRPFACRGVKCQCGKACHGTTVESVEILIDVAHYVSGGLEIQGSKGSRAVIRADRLD